MNEDFYVYINGHKIYVSIERKPEYYTDNPSITVKAKESESNIIKSIINLLNKDGY